MADMETPAVDERLQHISIFRRLMKRPELGAIIVLIVVLTFFFFTGDRTMFSMSGVMNWMTPAAQLGILAIGAAALMIGGEFDLSIGSMVAFTGFIFATLVVTFGVPLVIAIPLTLVLASVMGVINANIVIRTGLPSFIVTLAFLFILRGVTLVGLKWATGGATQLRGVRDATQDQFLAKLFSGDIFSEFFQWLADIGLIASFKNGLSKTPGLPVEIIWFVLLALVTSWVLLKTPFGNWIFATGGDANAASNSGVPVRRVKISLFIFTACCAALVAIITVLDSGSTDASRGFQKEFIAIIAAVIGGCFLTGGYGSAIGAFLGAIIFGVVQVGLSYTQIDQDWYLVFLGGILLVAMMFNNMIRRWVTGEH